MQREKLYEKLISPKDLRVSEVAKGIWVSKTDRNHAVIYCILMLCVMAYDLLALTEVGCAD